MARSGGTRRPRLRRDKKGAEGRGGRVGIVTGAKDERRKTKDARDKAAGST